MLKLSRKRGSAAHCYTARLSHEIMRYASATTTDVSNVIRHPPLNSTAPSFSTSPTKIDFLAQVHRHARHCA